jgi:hypothetical protein
MIFYLFDNDFLLGTKLSHWHPGSGSGYLSQDHGSLEPEPIEIYTDLQHCKNHLRVEQEI